MDELERILWNWVQRLCRCRHISEGKHKEVCPVAHIRDVDLDELYYDVEEYIEDCEEGAAEEAVEEYLKRLEPVEVQVIGSDDPE